MYIRVFIYEDNEARRDSLRALIESDPGFIYAGDQPNCAFVEKDMESAYPDVVLMDINMPVCDGISGLSKIKPNFPHIKVLIQTVFDDSEKVFECIKNGASGYILKKDSPTRILQAIREVYEGGAAMNHMIAQKILHYFNPGHQKINLSERELQVLKLLSSGISYKMIADQLGLSFHTVNTHMKNIYDKLHVSSMGEAIAYYYKNIH